MGTPDVFPRLNRPVGETNLSAQPNSNPLQNTVPLHGHKEPEIKEKSFISQVPNDQSLFSLYCTSQKSVPVFPETLRMYPIIPSLERKCCSDLLLPAPTGTGTMTLPAGTGVYIPVLGLHFDAMYFPEPQKFD
jgi:hypothetical protein